MKSLKSGLIVLAVILFLVGAYFVNKPRERSLVSEKNPSNIKLSSLVPETNNSYNFDVKNNLTKTLGQNLFEEIRANNLANKEKDDLPADINSISEKLANSVINESLADFKLISTIYDSDIKISPDITKETKTRYLETIAEINQKNFGSFNKNHLQVIVDVYQKIDPSSASRLANIYKNLAADFLKVAAPADWVGIHKALIIHAKNAEIIYKAMANYPVDPIKGYLALETIDALIDDIGKIKNTLTEKLKEISS
ncbi:MAG: hypothetical protein AAB404_00405 [Patescibacteria group bacterium]